MLLQIKGCNAILQPFIKIQFLYQSFLIIVIEYQ